ncbi:hypothetical protein FRACYDRAFT_270557 [Fragilariopsis cylindrus CCMP1102]|uniref:Uncharacterized protein n=1 Tax=Fragilariopsis cylindrus CCMP1102 TaxID=635003 RepID=A0A1E7F286_9STRA|nr:hypothetical protein FRACYDRAFT_270557 [Fragilariopsis cylindrus CCMP1102]|eukprot:OEU12236.1 hypothetical protein FRACYDRAFT_270557 [Fragilariopsis cylindrus CCMP1102]
MTFFGGVFRDVYSISNSNEKTITIVITAINVAIAIAVAIAITNTTIRRKSNPTTTPWTFPTSITVICGAVVFVIDICGTVFAIATILVLRIFIIDRCESSRRRDVIEEGGWYRYPRR